jgi:nucleoside 2-deoxyribosyltransferase
MRHLNVYLAGPLFTLAERMFNQALVDAIVDHAAQDQPNSMTIYVPQAITEKNPTSIYFKHMRALNAADVVVAIADGADPDSGTAFEMGFASAREIPIIAVRTDFRRAADTEECPYNLMLHTSASAVIDMDSTTHDIDSLAEAVYEMIKTYR